MPHDEISIQLYTLRDAMEDQAGFDLVMNRLAQYGYEKVELAGNYGGRTPRAAAYVPRRPRDPGVLEP